MGLKSDRKRRVNIVKKVALKTVKGFAFFGTKRPSLVGYRAGLDLPKGEPRFEPHVVVFFGIKKLAVNSVTRKNCQISIKGAQK